MKIPNNTFFVYTNSINLQREWGWNIYREYKTKYTKYVDRKHKSIEIFVFVWGWKGEPWRMNTYKNNTKTHIVYKCL